MSTASNRSVRGRDVEWTEQAKADLAKLSSRDVNRIEAAVGEFARTGRGNFLVLKGFDPPRSRLRVGSRRVILEFGVASAHGALPFVIGHFDGFLDAHAVWKLGDLMRAHAAAYVSIAELDTRPAEGLAGLQEQVRLLETVPGIDRSSACAILVELGPDLSAFEKTANVAERAGLALGNNESAGKR